MKTQLGGTGLVGPIALAHPPSPDAPGRPVLRDLLEEVAVRVEEKTEPRGELVDTEAARHRRFDVGKTVGQREGELLGGRRAGLADVVARDRDGMPARQLGGTEAHHVGYKAHRRARWEDVFLLRLVLLQDVVLQGARKMAALDAGLV